MDEESASFYLYGYSATINTNNMGYELKFNNFNMRECLGDLYFKYDKFKLVLNGISSFNGTTVSNNNRLVSAKMTGLDWVGVYDFGTKNKQIATLGVYQVGSNGGINTQTPSNWGCIFTKPSSPTVNLVITINDVRTNAIDTSINYQLNTFMFSIYGIN